MNSGVGVAINTTSLCIISALFIANNVFEMIIALLLACAVCLKISGNIAFLAKKFPSAPGIITYLRKVYSSKVSLFYVYIYILFVFYIGAIECSLFADIINISFPSVSPLLFSSLILCVIIFSNLLGIKVSRTVQILSTTLLVILLFYIGSKGLSQGSLVKENFNLSDGYSLRIISCASFGVFLFVGFEWIAPLGYNRESYKKLIPKAMKYSILFNLLLYSVLIAGIAAVSNKTEIMNSNLPHVIYAKDLFYHNWKTIIFSITLVCIISTFNVGIMGGSKLIYTLAREKTLPAIFLKKFNNTVPSAAILLIGIVVEIFSILIYYFKLEVILACTSSIIMCIVYIAMIDASIKLEKKDFKESPYKYYHLNRALSYLAIIFLATISGASIFSLPGNELIIFNILSGSIVIAIVLSLYYAKAKKKILTNKAAG